MRNDGTKAYRKLVLWTSLSTACALLALFTLTRAIIVTEIGFGIRPFIPLEIIPWIAASLIAVVSIGLYALSKVNLTIRIANAITLATALLVFAFFVFLIVEMFTAKNNKPWDRVVPASQSPRVRSF